MGSGAGLGGEGDDIAAKMKYQASTTIRYM
jgi:hypothetical protein